MTCAKCEGATSVIGTAKDSDCVYRKRRCQSCGYTFYTEECEAKNGVRYLELYNAQQQVWRSKRK